MIWRPIVTGCIVFAALFQATYAQQLGVGSLIAGIPKSHDPILAQSVILLIHYDRDGAMGLIVNRRTGTTYLGGPISLGVRTLFRSPVKPERGEHIVSDIYMLPNQGPVPKSATDHRTYTGYTGWSIQQLTDEVARGLWRIVKGDVSKVVFAPPSNQGQ